MKSVNEFCLVLGTELFFEIKVVDKKGHNSNMIVSEAVVLRCI